MRVLGALAVNSRWGKKSCRGFQGGSGAESQNVCVKASAAIFAAHEARRSIPESYLEPDTG
jgi:hypothetical protein